MHCRIRCHAIAAHWIALTTILGLFLMAASSGRAASGAQPNFGPNVLVFAPSMSATAMQQQIDQVYAVQRRNEFGPQRNALLFLPGRYKVDVPIGFYTEVMGLGASPDNVEIDGNLHSDASEDNNNATTTFWRGAEGIAVNPPGGSMRWAVSQAAPFRRMHVRGTIVLHQFKGWASGGWMSDDLIDGTVDAGPQQQWISRNTEWGKWTGSNWNMVFVGVPDPPGGAWPSPPYTKIALTPIVREKPFLQVDAAGNYSVCVPSLRRNSSGITWHGGSTPGKSIPLDHFYTARAGIDTAASINAQLEKGKDLLLTPGIYDLTDAIQVTRPDTVVLGMGFATLRPIHGTPAMTTADADGIIIAGLLFDAGPVQSPVLLQIGPDGSNARHTNDPISLHDVFFRVGGAGDGRTLINLKINSNDTILDHTWIWRADHGSAVGWDLNTSNNGLVVNGNNVTIYGLACEHFQQYQTLWNGNGGSVYFYQSEEPYDVPNQASWMNGTENGYASYKVANTVTSHTAWGLGIYNYFTSDSSVALTNAIEVPTSGLAGAMMHNMTTVGLGGGSYGSITAILDGYGPSTANSGGAAERLAQ